jgi:hypothetical protein
MNKKAGSCDLDDDEIVNAELEVIELLDYDKKLVKRKAEKIVVKTKKSSIGPVACYSAADCIHADLTCSCACNNGQDLLANILQVLDPSLWHAHADDQSVNALQTGQIFTLSSQFWESQRQVEALRNQLAQAEHCCHTAEWCTDCAELMEMMSASQGHPLNPGLPPHAGCQPHGSWCSCCCLRQEVYYVDGGCLTWYLGSDDDNEAEIQGNNDSPRTHCYTFEDDDQPESPAHFLTFSKPPSSSLPTSSSQALAVPPKMGCKATTSVSIIGSPLRYPSLEVWSSVFLYLYLLLIFFCTVTFFTFVMFAPSLTACLVSQYHSFVLLTSCWYITYFLNKKVNMENACGSSY